MSSCRRVFPKARLVRAQPEGIDDDALVGGLAGKRRRTEASGEPHENCVHEFIERAAALDRRAVLESVEVGGDVVAVVAVDPGAQAGIGSGGRVGGRGADGTVCVAAGDDFDALVVALRIRRLFEAIGRGVLADTRGTVAGGTRRAGRVYAAPNCGAAGVTEGDSRGRGRRGR